MASPHPYVHYLLVALLQSMGMLGIAFLIHSWTNGTVIDWSYNDADHYATIAQRGYTGSYTPAFFPAFPYVWRALGLSAFAMALFNGAIWIAVAAWIGKLLQLNLREFALGMVMPLGIFYFVPYSESFFALGIAVVLTGLQRKSLIILLLGVLWCSITRPVFVVLVPALILSFSAGFPRRVAVKWSLSTVLMAAISFLAVLWFQGSSTGNWLSFFEAQKAWGNNLCWPQFPLQTWGKGFNTLLDGSALALAFACGLMFFFLLREERASAKKRIQVMALAFLAGTGLLVLFTRGGLVFSLSRFMYASPLILVVIPLLISKKPKAQNVFYYIGVFLIFATSFGAYQHIETFMQSLGLGLLVFGMWKAWHFEQANWKWVVISVLLILQGYVGSLFMAGQWIA